MLHKVRMKNIVNTLEYLGYIDLMSESSRYGIRTTIPFLKFLATESKFEELKITTIS